MNPFVGGNRTTDKLIKGFFFFKANCFSNEGNYSELVLAQLQTEGAVCEEGVRYGRAAEHLGTA